MSDLMTNEDFTTPADRRYESFEVISGGVSKTCRIQSLTELEQSSYEAEVNEGQGGNRTERLKKSKRKLVALCVVDADGKRVLSEADIARMQKADGGIISYIFGKCLDHINVSENDFEALVKNSNATDDA